MSAQPETVLHINRRGPKGPHKHHDPPDHDFWNPSDGALEPGHSIALFMWPFGPLYPEAQHATARFFKPKCVPTGLHPASGEAEPIQSAWEQRGIVQAEGSNGTGS